MKRILVVDDTAFMRMSLKMMIEKNGFKVVGEAATGVEGVNQYKKLNPDLVTMDITMPEMDGIQALKELKKINNNAKVVIISAIGQETRIKEAIVGGAAGFIVKPFKPDHVIKTLEKILK